MRYRFAVGFPVALVSIALVGTIVAGDAAKSGLKPGDAVSPFEVDDITGPNKGKTLCYR